MHRTIIKKWTDIKKIKIKMEKTRGNRKCQEIITFQFFIPGNQKLCWSKVVMDFQIIVELDRFFECQNLSNWLAL
jgi:hypothetical protein